MATEKLSAGDLIDYRGKDILVLSDCTYKAYYSKYSANRTKDCKTLEKAKAQIDKWLAE